MTEENKVQCNTCKRYFPEVFEGSSSTNQGHRCASEVVEKGIEGFFGSTVIDMDFWKFKDEHKPGYVMYGTICDDCILELKNKGSIEYQSESSEMQQDFTDISEWFEKEEE